MVIILKTGSLIPTALNQKQISFGGIGSRQTLLCSGITLLSALESLLAMNGSHIMYWGLNAGWPICKANGIYAF